MEPAGRKSILLLRYTILKYVKAMIFVKLFREKVNLFQESVLGSMSYYLWCLIQPWPRSGDGGEMECWLRGTGGFGCASLPKPRLESMCPVPLWGQRNVWTLYIIVPFLWYGTKLDSRVSYTLQFCHMHNHWCTTKLCYIHSVPQPLDLWHLMTTNTLAI